MRTLAYGAGGFAAAVFLAHYALALSLLPWAAGAAGALALLALLLPRAARRRAVLALFFAAAGFLWYGGFAHARLAPVESVSREEQTVTARVTEYPQAYTRSVGLTVVITGPELPVRRARLYDYDGNCDDLVPGDEIAVTVKLRPATERYGEETDTYLARGIYYLGTVKDAPVKTGVWRWRALYFPKTLSRTLKSAAQAVFPADAFPFAGALMLGDKQAMYDADLDISFADAGIAHTVAVSGMHLTYLLGFLRLLAGRRRRTAVLALPLLAAFAMMTGASASILRAVVMAAILLLAPILGRENDPPTSLLAALALLLAENPFSAGSVALQLSFGSLAGIFLFSGALYRGLCRRLAPEGAGRVRRPVGVFLAGTLATTVGSMAFTVPLSALHFGTVSLIAPVTNLLVLWLLPACFIGCYAAALAGLLWPWLGGALAGLVAWPLRYILLTAQVLARVPGAVLSAENPLIVAWIALVYLCGGALWLRARRGRRPRLAPAGCVCALALVAAVSYTSWYTARTPRVAALDVGQGQSIAFLTAEDTVLVDCGGNASVDNAGDIAAQYLRTVGRGAVELLVLTHPHEDHVNGVERLLKQVEVEMLALPAAADATAEPLLSILATAAEEGTAVRYIDADTTLALDELSVALYAELGREKEDGCIQLRVSYGDFDTLITGDVDTKVERQLAETQELAGTELIVAGHHGSRYATGDDLLEAVGASRAIVSCGYNSYGHPTEETLARLAAHDITVYRTDELGTVTIPMD